MHRTAARDTVPGPGAGTRASRPQCRTAAAGCTAGCRPTGNRNALKHGRYIAEAVARRHEIGALLHTMRALSGMTEAES